jgi:hypothetical protein
VLAQVFHAKRDGRVGWEAFEQWVGFPRPPLRDARASEQEAEEQKRDQEREAGSMRPFCFFHREITLAEEKRGSRKLGAETVHVGDPHVL